MNEYFRKGSILIIFLQFSNIEKGVSIIGGAGQAFNSIGKEIHSMTDQISDISDTSEEFLQVLNKLLLLFQKSHLELPQVVPILKFSR